MVEACGALPEGCFCIVPLLLSLQVSTGHRFSYRNHGASMTSSKRKHLKPGEKVVLLLTEEQAGLIVELTYISEDLIATIHHSKLRDGIVSTRCTIDQLEDLSGCIAAEANHTKDKKLQKKLE